MPNSWLLTDAQLRDELTEHGIEVGPINKFTRKVYCKKLDTLQCHIENVQSKSTLTASGTPGKEVVAQSRITAASDKEIDSLSDLELKDELAKYHVTASPICDSTRETLRIRLNRCRREAKGKKIEKQVDLDEEVYMDIN